MALKITRCKYCGSKLDELGFCSRPCKMGALLKRKAELEAEIEEAKNKQEQEQEEQEQQEETSN